MADWDRRPLQKTTKGAEPQPGAGDWQQQQQQQEWRQRAAAHAGGVPEQQQQRRDAGPQAQEARLPGWLENLGRVFATGGAVPAPDL